MSKFFKPEDFVQNGRPANWDTEDYYTPSEIAAIANAKLERKGKVVYQHNSSLEVTPWYEHEEDEPNKTHKALLINIEPMEKCKHPKARVVQEFEGASPLSQSLVCFYVCQDCNAKLKPSAYEEIE